MNLKDIQELGFAAICLKQVSDSLTDEKLKARTLIQAGLVMDAHDELLATHRTSAMINEATEKAVAATAVGNDNVTG